MASKLGTPNKTTKFYTCYVYNRMTGLRYYILNHCLQAKELHSLCCPLLPIFHLLHVRSTILNVQNTFSWCKKYASSFGITIFDIQQQVYSAAKWRPKIDYPKVYELVTLATPLCGQRSIEEKVTQVQHLSNLKNIFVCFQTRQLTGSNVGADAELSNAKLWLALRSKLLKDVGSNLVTAKDLIDLIWTEETGRPPFVVMTSIL